MNKANLLGLLSFLFSVFCFLFILIPYAQAGIIVNPCQAGEACSLGLINPNGDPKVGYNWCQPPGVCPNTPSYAPPSGTTGNCPVIPAGEFVNWSTMSCPVGGVPCDWNSNYSCPAGYVGDDLCGGGNCQCEYDTTPSTASFNTYNAYFAIVCKPATGGGGGPGCTVVNGPYSECETNPNFGACGHYMNNHGGQPVLITVTQYNNNTCGSDGQYNCQDNNITCNATISGHAYYPGNAPASGVNINVAGQNLTTGADGSYSLGGVNGGTYNDTITPPANYTVSNNGGSTTTNLTVDFNNRNPVFDWNLAPTVYNVSGTVYTDTNNNGVWNSPPETNVGAGITVTTNTGAQATTDANGNYTLPNLTPATYTLTLGGAIPAGDVAPQTYQVTVSNADIANENLRIIPTYSVTGQVFNDNDNSGTYNSGDSAYTSSRVVLTDSNNTKFYATVDINGNYSFTGVWPQNVTMSLETVPANSTFSTPVPYPKGVSVFSNQTINFGIVPLQSISGEIYTNTYKDFVGNANACYEKGYDQLYTSSQVTISITGPVNKTINTSSGTFTSGTALPPGTYSVSYTSALPSGYEIKTPSTYSVVVGPNSCDASGAHIAVCDSVSPPSPVPAPTQPSCSSGNVQDVSFGLNNENAFFQTFCEDYRNDQGIDDPLPPAGTLCGSVPASYLSYTNASCNIAGIVYYNGSTYFGQGQANPNNQVVNSAYAPVNTSLDQMAYSFVEDTMQQRGVTPVLNGVDGSGNAYCGVNGYANCSLEANLPPGIYQIGPQPSDNPAPSDLKDLTITSIDPNTFVVPTPNSDGTITPNDYIFLVSGNINIKTNIILPNNVAAAFVAQKGINVDGSVGEQTVTSTTPDLEGIYVAGGDFTLQTLGQTGQICKSDGTNLDKRLNILGFVHTGAEGAGVINNQRDLCSYDLSCPVDTTTTGDDGRGSTFLLNLSDVFKTRGNYEKELLPGP